LVLFGLLVAAVVAEGALRVAALFVEAPSGIPYASLLGGSKRLVCLGDSNTYGLYVGWENAYPRFLQQRAGPQARVLNLAYPGNNSTAIRDNLTEVLDKLLPDVVTVMIGVNDFWTVPIEKDASSARSDGWRAWLWRHSRVFRLVFMIRRSFLQQELEVSFVDENNVTAKLGDTELTIGPQYERGRVPGWRERLRANLTAIVGEIERSGSQPILVCYPAERGNYKWANAMLREIAAATGTPLIDLGAYFQTFCPAGTCTDVFFPDSHPTVEGHKRAADEIWHQMVDRGILVETK